MTSVHEFPAVGTKVRVLGSPSGTFNGAVGTVILSASVTHVSFPDGRSERFWYEDLEQADECEAVPPRGKVAPESCYADRCILPRGHKPGKHRAANGYEWPSVHPPARRAENPHATLLKMSDAELTARWILKPWQGRS